MCNYPYIHEFDTNVANITLPERFTYPFCYEPHQLATLASSQLQNILRDHFTQTHDASYLPEGKMYGVLVVKKHNGQLGFLVAYSGKESLSERITNFVPQIVNISDKDSFFVSESNVINHINTQIVALEKTTELTLLQQSVNKARENYQSLVGEKQQQMAELRKQRKLARSDAKLELTQEQYVALDKRLSGESISQKKQLLQLKSELNNIIVSAESELNEYTLNVSLLKKQRKKLSNKLQKKLFSQYKFSNANGGVKNLNEIFTTVGELAPSGTGDCAAPKLLQYAFDNQLTPITMAEFWWGAPPKSKIRQHGKYYPACQNKCAPLLGHMLEGLKLDPNPLLENLGEGKTIDIVFEDNDIVVINKPEGLLSVPGKLVNDSVLVRMKANYPAATGPLIVHRLDMSTSGLMVIALTPRANKSLQQQFVTRKVEKHYIALIQGHVNGTSGEITLPLRQDLDDRPRQMVCYEMGKPCVTKWRVLSQEGLNTRMMLEPKTGRTHQLRMHCAHPLGLAMPIVGDDLYGQKGNRLCLHAKSLSFEHPITKEFMSFNVEPNF